MAVVDEDKKGLKSFLSFSWAYDLIQFVAGANIFRTKMVEQIIKPFDGCKILDIGCGTGEYVEFFDKYGKKYEYHGFDSELNYIESGRKRYKGRSEIQLHHQILTKESVKEIGQFDIAMSIGVMHHMNDDVVLSLLQTAKAALKPNGRLITYDPGRFPDENIIEKFLADNDRGQHIRTKEGYEKLVKQVFENYKCHILDLSYYPNRTVVFECTL